MKNIIFYVLLVLPLLLVSTFSYPLIHQNCTTKSRSQCGVATICDSNAPLPLSATATIQLTKKIWWNGFDSWQYAIENAKGQIVKLEDGCMQGQSQGGEYGSGANITVHFVCNKLPRDLVKGDKIWMYVFADSKNPDNWLMLNIPI